MGKTRLALAEARAQTTQFPDGSAFVPLADVNGPDEIVSALATALHLVFQDEQRAPKQQLVDFLRGRRALLLLDNFEHLLEGIPLLVTLLKEAPAVKLLITSRERLHLAAETLFQLNGLRVPANGSAEYKPGQHSAVELFMQTARRLRQGFADDAHIPAVIRICRLVGGMPLGLVLAAGLVDVLTPAEIATALEQNLAILQTDLRDIDLRHRSVVAVLAQSWQQLSGEEQRALMALSVFSGDFDREAAQTAAAATLPVLTRLIHRSWMGVSEAGRYTLHELLRQFARTKLRETQHESALCSRHCAFYAGRIAHHAKRLHTDQRQQAIAAIAADQANGMIAWDWATAHGDAQKLGEMCDGLAAHFLRSRLYAHGERLFGAAIDTLRDDERALLGRIRLLLHQTHLCVQQGRRDPARRALKEVSRHLLSPDIRDDEILRERGLVLFWEAHLGDGADHILPQQKFSQSLTCFRACNDSH